MKKNGGPKSRWTVPLNFRKNSSFVKTWIFLVKQCHLNILYCKLGVFSETPSFLENLKFQKSKLTESLIYSKYCTVWSLLVSEFKIPAFCSSCIVISLFRYHFLFLYISFYFLSSHPALGDANKGKENAKELE